MAEPSDAETGYMMARLTSAERLARACLMFFNASIWTAGDREVWHALTGYRDCTTVVLCDLARRVRTEEERKRG